MHIVHFMRIKFVPLHKFYSLYLWQHIGIALVFCCSLALLNLIPKSEWTTISRFCIMGAIGANFEPFRIKA